MILLTKEKLFMMEKFEEEKEEKLCALGWYYFRTGKVNEAIEKCIKLQNLIKEKKREPTRSEKMFIDTIKEAVKLENES